MQAPVVPTSCGSIHLEDCPFLRQSFLPIIPSGQSIWSLPKSQIDACYMDQQTATICPYCVASYLKEQQTLQKGRAMVSHQGKIMTEARPPLQKKPRSPSKNADRLARALRENLHRRKAQARSRAVAAVTDDPAAPSDTDTQKRSAGDSSNG